MAGPRRRGRRQPAGRPWWLGPAAGVAVLVAGLAVALVVWPVSSPAPPPPPPAKGDEIVAAHRSVTRLMVAAYHGALTHVAELVAGGADVNLVDRAGYTALHHALEGYQNAVLQALVQRTSQHRAVFDLLVAQPRIQLTKNCPLYYAVYLRNIPAVAALLDRMDAEDVAGCLLEEDAFEETTLHALVRSKSSGFVRLLHRAHLAAAQGKRVNPEVLATLNVSLVPGYDPREGLSMSGLNSAIGEADFDLVAARLAPALWRTKGWHGNTPLHLAAHAGRTSLVRKLLSLGLDPHLTNAYEQTPLHMAAMAGCGDVVRLLIAKGADVGRQDRYARTPGDVAQLLSFSHLSELLPPSGDTGPPPATPFVWTRTSNRGWAGPELGAPPACTIARIPASELEDDGDAFERDFLSIRRPVIVTGLCSNASSQPAWDRPRFLDRYGAVAVQVASIPYAETYGLVGDTRTMTLAEYVSGPMGAGARRPPYVFDAQVLDRQPELGGGELPSPFSGSPILKQFILGPAGSGSQPHFHGSAVNMLLFGRKHWVLFPPAQSVFKVSPAAEWFETDLPKLRQEGQALFECVQQEGDVVFVPELWGHAVLNLWPSLAKAVEYHE